MESKRSADENKKSRPGFDHCMSSSVAFTGKMLKAVPYCDQITIPLQPVHTCSQLLPVRPLEHLLELDPFFFH